MKPILIKNCFSLLGLIVLIACTPQVTPSATTVAKPTSPSLVPVDLAGPETKVASTWLYADGTLLVAVPGGSFTRGGSVPDAPLQQIQVSDFWMYRTKVTNAQFAYCVDMGGCTPPAKHDDPDFRNVESNSMPVVGVDFAQASAYCTFVHARLPTEAEWEKAARGPDGRVYPWGDAAPNCSLLNYDKCVDATTPVTDYPGGQSFYTAYDMEGNALEWVSDWYDANYYASGPAADPQGPGNGRFRVVRSSAFNSGGNQTETYNRFYSDPDVHRNNLGFRCAVDDPTYFAPYCDYPATYGTESIGGPKGGAQPTIDCAAYDISQASWCDGSQAHAIVRFVMGAGASAQIIGGDCIGYTDITQPSNVQEVLCTQDATIQACAECKVTVTSSPQCPQGYHYNQDLTRCEYIPGAEWGTNCLAGHAVQNSAGCCAVATSPTLTAGATPAYMSCSANPNLPVQSCGMCPDGKYWDGAECSDTDQNTVGAMSSDETCAFGIASYDTATNTITKTCFVPRSGICPVGTNFDGQECISTTYQNACESQDVSYISCQPQGGGDGGGGDDTEAVCEPPPGGCFGGSPNYTWNTQTCTCDCTTC